MAAIKIEAFVGQPPCPGCRELEELCRQMQELFGDRLECLLYRGVEGLGRMEARGIKVVPAILLEDLIRIEGVCPSRETLLKALGEVGLTT